MKVLALDTSTWRLDAALASVEEDGSFEVIAAARHETGKGMHSRLLPGLLFDLLADAGAGLSDLDGMAAGLGPGSFTGLRTGVSTLAAISYAARIELVGASSLASMALAAASTEILDERCQTLDSSGSLLLVPVLDARRGQVYAGFYRMGEAAPKAKASGDGREAAISVPRASMSSGSRLEALEDEAVMSPEDLLAVLDEHGGAAALVGSGLEAHECLQSDSRAVPGAAWAPTAVELARLCAPRLGGGFETEKLFSLQPRYVRNRIVEPR